MPRLIKIPPKLDSKFNTNEPDPSSSWAPHNIYNIGNSDPIELIKYIEAIEDSLCIKSIKNYLPMQKGDVASTAADTSSLENWIGFKPETNVKEGVDKFIEWYISYIQNN